MIGSLKGRILTKRPENFIVETNGVGYQVNVPISTLSLLPHEGQEVFLYIYTHVREDSLQLYGFMSEDEKRVFVSLLGITGIGPRVALNILSGISYQDLLMTIEAEDVRMLTRIPGLGKKTAERLILELRGKLPLKADVRDRVFEDALSALINLGYKKPVAEEVLGKTYKKGSNDIEGTLKEALKLLSGGENEKRR
ncbi:MAG: Holliday junction branch migration protein RuvA [Nitrospirae bacterium]|nr:Holliday junction branch migration protein RuvA [Nitrospirota bacterium]